MRNSLYVSAGLPESVSTFKSRLRMPQRAMRSEPKLVSPETARHREGAHPGVRLHVRRNRCLRTYDGGLFVGPGRRGEPA